MFSVFLTRRIPEAGMAMLNGRSNLAIEAFPKDEPISRRALLKGARGKDGILSLLTERIDAEVMDAAGPQLKLIANYAVGFDNIDLDAAAKRGIIVTNTPGALTDAVAEHTIALMLAAARRIAEGDRLVRKGRYKGWGPTMLLGTGLAGKTLGIIGAGRIGGDVALRAAKGLKMRVQYSDVKQDEHLEKTVGAERVSLEALLADSDVVSVHVPLLPATHHLLDASKLGMMKRSAILVNTSRGAVIDEAALVAALANGVIAGAGLDVYEHEPKLARGLARLERVVLTPHTASATIEARSEMARLAAQAVLDVMDGKTPAHTVNK